MTVYSDLLRTMYSTPSSRPTRAELRIVVSGQRGIWTLPPLTCPPFAFPPCPSPPATQGLGGVRIPSPEGGETVVTA